MKGLSEGKEEGRGGTTGPRGGGGGWYLPVFGRIAPPPQPRAEAVQRGKARGQAGGVRWHTQPGAGAWVKEGRAHTKRGACAEETGLGGKKEGREGGARRRGFRV